MSSVKAASRYSNIKATATTTSSSFDSRSSTMSDPSSSTDHLTPKLHIPSRDSSRALAKTKPTTTHNNFSSIVKKLVDTKSRVKQKGEMKLVIPADFIAEDLKKTARRGTGLSGLHKKLFKGSSGVKAGDGSGEKKALTEVKANTRTLAMVLRSERELLSMNKEQESKIAELNLMLEEKNREVEKLKDLCLKQREEIKALKSAILFPDVMNSQLQNLLEKQGSELKQAKQLIPNLQRQVTTLTGQLQSLADDLAEVKADKYSVRGCYDNFIGSPRTPASDEEESSHSLEFSSEDQTSPRSPDDMFIKDLNPCLTPYYSKSKSKEFELHGSPQSEDLCRSNKLMQVGCSSRVRKMSKSSDCCQHTSAACTSLCPVHRSDESKRTYGKGMDHKLFQDVITT